MRFFILMVGFVFIAGFACATSPFFSIRAYPESSKAQNIQCDTKDVCRVSFSIEGAPGLPESVQEIGMVGMEMRPYEPDLFDVPPNAVRVDGDSKFQIHQKKIEIPFVFQGPGVFDVFLEFEAQSSGVFPFFSRLSEHEKKITGRFSVVVEDGEVWINHSVPDIFYAMPDPQKQNVLNSRIQKIRRENKELFSASALVDEVCMNTPEKMRAPDFDYLKARDACDGAYDKLDKLLEQEYKDYSYSAVFLVNPVSFDISEKWSKQMNILPFSPVMISVHSTMPLDVRYAQNERVVGESVFGEGFEHRIQNNSANGLNYHAVLKDVIFEKPFIVSVHSEDHIRVENGVQKKVMGEGDQIILKVTPFNSVEALMAADVE